MKFNIHKLADYLVSTMKEGIPLERKLYEFKQAESRPASPVPTTKAS